jgi:hypothetical protein
VLLGAAWSLLINVGNVLTPVAFPGSTAYATNLANVFFGLGAFLTPLAVAFMAGSPTPPTARRTDNGRTAPGRPRRRPDTNACSA